MKQSWTGRKISSTRKLAATLTAAAALLAGCGSGDPLDTGVAQGGGSSVVVGSASFPESELIAQLFAVALEDEGVKVATKLNIGSREAYIPALKDGSIDVVPDYSGNSLAYFSPDNPANSAEEVRAALVGSLPDHLAALDFSAAQDKDALVVTPEFAAKNNVRSLEDLAPLCGQVVVAGAPTFRERSYGLPAVEKAYGCTVKGYEPFNDAGGPATLNALLGGQAQAANIFTTTPSIKQHSLVVLEDPKNVFVAQEVFPLVRKSRITLEAAEAINEVMGKLTTEDLIGMNEKVSGEEKADTRAVAEQWLREKGLLDQ